MAKLEVALEEITLDITDNNSEGIVEEIIDLELL